MLGRIFIVSAPSGAGKTSLISALLEKWSVPKHLERVVTFTTKQPRSTEMPGKDYHFVSKEKFSELIDLGFFLEWSIYCDHYYGTPNTIIEEVERGKSFILIVDRAGAKQLIEKLKNIVTIWIYTSTILELKRRLIARGTETAEFIEHRLARASLELEEERIARSYKYHIINKNFHETLSTLQALFLKELEIEIVTADRIGSIENTHSDGSK